MRKFITILLVSIITISTQAQKQEWISLEKATQLNKETPKGILLSISSTGNFGWNMKTNKLFKDDSLKAYINKNYYTVNLKANYKEDIVIEKDTFRYIANDSIKEHQLLTILADSNIKYPAHFIFDPQYNIVYQNNKTDKIQQLDSILQNIDLNSKTLAKRAILTPEETIEAPVVETKPVELKWYTIEEAVELNKTEPRKIVIDVYTNWCGWCKVMDKKTFKQPLIADYLNTNYYAVKFNAEQRGDVNILGSTYKYVQVGNRGSHELAAALGATGYPYVVFLDENMNIITALPGFTKAPQFDRVINYINGEHYKTADFETWSKTYTTKVKE